MVVILAAIATTACEQVVAPESDEALRKDLDAVAAQVKPAGRGGSPVCLCA
jgi:hypothetical protein